MKSLNPFDLDLEKTTLIQASAGTGKTYTIATLVIRLLAQGYPVESILVVTFTEAAAAELKLRVRQRLVQVIADLGLWIDAQDQGPRQNQHQEESCSDPLISCLLDADSPDHLKNLLSHALICFDQASIMTIHSFCLQVLKVHAFESGAPFDMTLSPDAPKFLEQIGLDFFMARMSNLDSVSLDFLDSKQISPESFIRDLMPAISRPRIRVIPDVCQFVDVSAQWKEICDSILDILEHQADEILERIQADPGINKRSYSRKNVPNWIQASLKDFHSHREKTPLFDMEEKGHPLYKFTAVRIAKNTKQGFAPLSHPLFDLCQELVSLSRVLTQNLVALQWECMEFCQEQLSDIRNRQGICFFDDLINDLATALEGPRKHQLSQAVSSTYKACLIDEFQDTDAGQYRIFSSLFAHAGIPFFMIGDPKQAIYAFRGGDIFTYLSAVRDSEQKFTLDTNYRSSQGLVQAVNQIFSSVDDPFLFPDIEFMPVDSPPEEMYPFVKKDQSSFQVCMISRDGFLLDRNGYVKKEDALAKIPGLVADRIRADLDSNDLSFRDKEGNIQQPALSHMAVLVRTNDQAQAVYQALSRLNIPCFVAKTGSVFASPEAGELYEIMTAVARPDESSRIRAALTTSIFGYSIREILHLNKQPGFMDSWQKTFFYFREIWQSRGVTAMIMALIHWPETLGRPGSEISERGLTNVFHLIELISCAQQEKDLSIPLVLDWLSRQLHDQTRQESQDELRLESDKKAVAIVTIHRSKGMEYPIVYLPYLWAYQKGIASRTVLFHDPEQANALYLDLCPGREDADGKSSINLAEQEARAEERRLLYVALTRASLLCRVFWAGVAGVENSALGQMIHPNGCGSDADMAEDWKKFEGPTKGSLGLEDMVFQNGPLYCSQETPLGNLTHRVLHREIYPGFSMTSFSAMAARSEEGLSITDHGLQNHDSEECCSRDSCSRILLSSFPKGAAAGDLFHGIFQDLDFCQVHNTIEEIAQIRFQEAGFEQQGLLEIACKAVAHVLSTPLCPPEEPPFCLGQIPLQDRRTEMEFVFPTRKVHPGQLARALGKNPLCASYVSRVEAFGYNALQGFIRGFIDLVVRWNGKWYLLDYKSNYLGDSYKDYGPENILKVMEEHDYFLQYHIYLAAMNRYLKLRLKDYDYQRDFGGVFYLFIRGMTGESGDTGIFYDRPSRQVLDQLDQTL